MGWDREVVASSTEPLSVPLQYRDVDLKVSKVVFNSDALEPEAGERLRVRVYGTGEPGGSRVVIGDREASWNEIVGPLRRGDEVLLLVRRQPFPMREGAVEMPVVLAHYQGLWALRDGEAVSEDPMRTVDEAELVSVIVAERAAGARDLTRAQAAATARDPLAPTPGVGWGLLGEPAGRQRPPADVAAARDGIDASFDVLFEVESDALTRLGVVVGGDGLYAQWGTQADRFVAALPPMDVQVTNVFFDSPSFARVEYRLQSSLTGEVWRTGTIVDTSQGWSVSASTLCADVEDLLGVVCPGGVGGSGAHK